MYSPRLMSIGVMYGVKTLASSACGGLSEHACTVMTTCAVSLQSAAVFERVRQRDTGAVGAGSGDEREHIVLEIDGAETGRRPVVEGRPRPCRRDR